MKADPVIMSEDTDSEAYGRGLGIRHLQVAVMATAILLSSTMVVNLSVAIVSMVDKRNDTHITDSAVPTYEWDEKIQGYVLSAFTGGYLISQVPAGILAEKYGAHRFLCTAILATSLLTLALPQCAYLGGWLLLCLNRVFQGISLGFVFPSIYTLLGVWAPPAERTRLTSISISAQLLGMLLAIPLTAFMSLKFGWPSVFYVLGAIGAAGCPVVFFLGADSPSKHQMISSVEKNYIHSSLGGAKSELSVPWREILSSAPVYCAICATSFQQAVQILVGVKIPTFLATALDVGLADNGILSASPLLAGWLLAFLFSWASDFLIDRKILRTTAARKLFNSIAHFGAAFFMILLAHADSKVSAVIFLTMAMGVQSANLVGVISTFIDLSPNFSGAINGVTNLVSGILSVFGPIIVGYVVSEKGSTAQWRYVFYACAAILILSNLVFLIWGTSETQWWNWPDKNIKEDQNQKKGERTGTSFQNFEIPYFN